MSIQRLKEITDTNDEVQTAGNEYNAIVDSKIQQIIDGAVRDFTKSMTENGFQVSRSGNEVQARYSSAGVALHLPLISDRPFGAVTTFRVSQTGKPIYVIVAMHKGSGFSISSGTVTITKTDELAEAKKRLAGIRESIKSYPSEEIVYRAQEDAPGLSILDAEAKGSFREALQVVLGE